MQLVKDGKLTVDEAMDKVLKVEESIAVIEKKVYSFAYRVYHSDFELRASFSSITQDLLSHSLGL
jgi:hypothetical protein